MGPHSLFSQTIIMSALAIILMASVLSAEAIPFLELYTLTDKGGAMINLTDYGHNLDTYGFDDMIQSYCGQGIWLLYEDRDYNGHTGNDFSHWTETFISGEYKCHNMPSTQHGQLSSLRYAGSGSLTDDTITLYHGFFFDGGEALFLKDEDNLSDMNNDPSSFVITGCTPWTLYQHRYYEGFAICVETWDIGNGICGGAFEVTEVGMPNNALSAIRKGCYSDKTITL